jgi:hypothetical protein
MKIDTLSPLTACVAFASAVFVAAARFVAPEASS